MRHQFPWDKINFLKRKNYILEENYHLLSNLYQKNERLYHDMNHHLQMIYHLAGRLNCPEIQEYVTSIHTPIMELSDMVWSGNDIVDAILNHAHVQAKKNGIHMDINAEYPKDCTISSDDICVILFNLLDNAMEASLKCDNTRNAANSEGNHKTTEQPENKASSPVISVTIRRIHEFLIIKVQNPYNNLPKKRFGLFTSSKSNTFHHGIGLKNVKEIVEKYHGSLEFETDNMKFTTTALLFL